MSDPTDPYRQDPTAQPNVPTPGQAGGMPPQAMGPGGLGGYEPMPSAPRAAPVTVGDAPTSVRRAVWLMYLSALLSLLGVIAAFASKSSVRDKLRDDHPTWSVDKLDDTVNAAVIIAVIISIIFFALWLWLAGKVGKGRNWARIVTWVLCALGVLNAITGLGGDTSALVKVVSAISGLIAIAIIVLLAAAPSNAYFARDRRMR